MGELDAQVRVTLTEALATVGMRVLDTTVRANFETLSAMEPCESCSLLVIVVEVPGVLKPGWQHISRVVVTEDGEVERVYLNRHTPEACQRKRAQPDWQLPWCPPAPG